MKLQAYSVSDTAVGAFNQPFFSRAHGEAKRAFIHACTKGQLVATALDSNLFHIGEFHDDSGTLIPNETPVRLMTGLEAIAAGTPKE